MKAVTIVSFGGVEGLEVREVADAPNATADRVRVRVRAAGINRADILQRLGRYPAPPGYPQEIPGLEFAGEVVEVGADARRWKVGDRVFGIIGGGGQAEYRRHHGRPGVRATACSALPAAADTRNTSQRMRALSRAFRTIFRGPTRALSRKSS